MSSKQIKSALVKKGYPVESVKYTRNAPTPSGFGKGYDIEFTNVNDSFVEFEDLVFDYNPKLKIGTYMDFDDLSQAIAWVESLPNVSQLREEQGDAPFTS